MPRGIDDSGREVEFERHTVWDEPGGLANRSGAGDLDVVVYSARTWCRLALAGNPTVLLAHFVPDEEVVFRDAVGELVANAHGSCRGWPPTASWATCARSGPPSPGRSERTRTVRLVATHGYDTKFAMHALRLGAQGVELLTEGRITLPVPEPDRAHLRAIRRGEVPLEQALSDIDFDDAERRLLALRAAADLPEQPDRAWGRRLAAPLAPRLLGPVALGLGA